MNSRIPHRDAITDGTVTARKAKEQVEALEEVKRLLAKNGIRSTVVLTIKLDLVPPAYQPVSYRPTELTVFHSGRQAAIVTTTGGLWASYVVRSPHRDGEDSLVKINDLESPDVVAALLSKILQVATS